MRTDEIHLDEASRAAVAALAHRVRNRDGAEDREDAELFALEYVVAMRGQGWRPTEARPVQPWQESARRPPAPPEVTRRGADLARKALHGGEIE